MAGGKNGNKTSMEQIAKESRRKCLDLVYKAQTSHIGSLFSCADLVAVIFSKIDLDKDKFLLSAGWKACMLYFHLWKKGRITEDELSSYCQEGSKFIGLAEPITPDIKIAGGSMGLGLPGAVGLALSKKMKGEDGKVYCLMSDGEMQIGTTWESAMIASQYNLTNLVVITDYNGLQAMGEVKDILNIEPLGNKWRTFGWLVRECNGHDFDSIEDALNFPSDISQPQAIIAKTVKGKGVSWMAGNNIFHYKQLSDDEYLRASEELK